MRKKLSVLVVALAALGVAACGGEIDSGELEDAIQSELQQELDSQPRGKVTLESVDCPSGQERETGHTFQCRAEASDGSTATIEAVVTDGDEGDVTWNVVSTSG